MFDKRILLQPAVVVLMLLHVLGPSRGLCKGKKSGKAQLRAKYGEVVKERRKLYLQALERTNHFRRLMGLCDVRLDDRLSMAAQAHADYLNDNPDHSHNQKKGRPGYVARTPWDRFKLFGVSGGYIECITLGSKPARAADGFVGTVYHRLPFIMPWVDRLGVGVGETRVVYTFGRDNTSWTRPVLMPADGQSSVPTSFHAKWETPKPLSHVGDPETVGYPLSIVFPHKVKFRSATLHNEDGEEVPIYVVHPGNDPAGLLKRSIFIMAKAPLEESETFTASVVTSRKKKESTTTWTFTTAGFESTHFMDAEARQSAAPFPNLLTIRLAEAAFWTYGSLHQTHPFTDVEVLVTTGRVVLGLGGYGFWDNGLGSLFLRPSMLIPGRKRMYGRLGVPVRVSPDTDVGVSCGVGFQPRLGWFSLFLEVNVTWMSGTDDEQAPLELRAGMGFHLF